MFENFIFEDPQFFWLLLLLPLALGWYVWKRNKETAELRISSIKGFEAKPGFLGKFRPVLIHLAAAGAGTGDHRPGETKIC